MNAAKKLVTFVKKETVLCIAGLLAVVSMFIIHPSADCFGYIDYRVLALLFCFMAVVAGFRSVGLFEWLIKKMLCYVKNARQLELVSMFIIHPSADCFGYIDTACLRCCFVLWQ